MTPFVTIDRIVAYSTLGVVQAGKLQVQDRTSFDRALARFPDGIVVVDINTSSPTALKSRRQEKGFHAMIAPWAKGEGYRVDDLKRDLLLEIFGEREHVNHITGVVSMVLREPHTSTLTRQQYSELIERTLEIAADCSYILEAPDEYRERRQREAKSSTERGLQLPRGGNHVDVT